MTEEAQTGNYTRIDDTNGSETLTVDAPEFLLSGDDVAESFMSLAAATDPLLLRTVFSNTALLLLASEKGDSQEMSTDEMRDLLTRVSNKAFALIVKELEAIRDAKVSFAAGVGVIH